MALVAQVIRDGSVKLLKTILGRIISQALPIQATWMLWELGLGIYQSILMRILITTFMADLRLNQSLAMKALMTTLIIKQQAKNAGEIVYEIEFHISPIYMKT